MGFWVLAVLSVALCCIRGAFVWWGLEGWTGITNGWPIWRHDHPLYYHSALVTRDFLARNGTTAGYDPAFMSGYAKSVVFPASSTLPELVIALFGGTQPALAYKLYVLIASSIVPWLIAASARLFGAGAGGICATLVGLEMYLWTDFPMNYVVFGMVPYFLAVPLSLLALGAFVRFCEGGGLAWWIASAFLMVSVVLVHFTTAMILAPAALAVYLASIREWRASERTFSRRRHLGVWLIPLLVLLLNAFWWVPGIWLASTKGPSDFAFAHPEGILLRFRKIIQEGTSVARELWLLGVPCLVLLTRRARVRGVALSTYAVMGFFWGYLAGGFRSLDFLQPGRHTYALYSAFCIASGIGVDHAVRSLARRSPRRIRLDWIAAVCLLVWAGWRVEPDVSDAIRSIRGDGTPILISSPTPRLLRVVRWVRRFVKPGERLLYEESGFGLEGIPDPFSTGRFSGLLPSMCGVELIGGPYLHAALTTNFTQFGEGLLFGRGDWDRSWFTKYARLYRPAAILCWSPRARAFCRANPDLVAIRADDGFVMIGRVLGFEGEAIQGKAEVEAGPGFLRVSNAEGGVDGTVILRYHSVPCLRAEPPVAWDSVYLEDDPVPFIRLRPPPEPVTFELRFPPGSSGKGTDLSQ